MKKITKRITVLGIMMMLILACVGCGKDPEVIEASNVSVIVGNCNNNPVMDCSIDELAYLMKAAGSPYTIIGADGKPSLIYEGVVPSFEDKGYTQVMLTRIQNSMQADLESKIKEATPSAPETDMAAALTLGIRAIRARETDDLSNTLVICHTGISTIGEINMIDCPISTMDIEQSVATLVDKLNLDMSGIHVVFYYLSDVRGDQTELSSEEVEKLKTFYDELFKGLGVESVTFKKRLALDETYNFPEQPVSCMPTEGVSSQLVKVVSAENVSDEDEVDSIFNEGEGITFNEKQIAFEPGTAEFLDKNAAKEALSYVIEFMSKNKEFELLICGGCAGDEGIDVESNYVAPPSEERGEAVKSIICDELGSDGTNITVKGLGSSGPFHQAGRGLGEDGSVNRTVTFLSSDSDQGKQILAEY